MPAVRHNVIKLEINNTKDIWERQLYLRKAPNIQRLQNIFLNNIWVKEEISKEILKYFKQNENPAYQNVWGCRKGSAWRKIYSIKCIY